MKKKIFYIFSHQDDEFGIFPQLKKDSINNEVFIFYFTSGTNKKIKKNRLILRDKESIKTLTFLGVKKKNIFFIGRKLEIKTNELHLNVKKISTYFENYILKSVKPDIIYTHSWEGGHEDHDTCNLLVRRFKKKFKIVKCFQYSLYNAYKTSIIYFRIFNPLKKKKLIKIKKLEKERLNFIKLLFNYRTQLKIWVGLYPFIIAHYLFKNYLFIEELDINNVIKRPHRGELLYEKRKFCKFSELKKSTKCLLS